jgi:hypothetical protein
MKRVLATLFALALAVPAWAGGDAPKGITVDKEKRLVIVDAKVAPRILEYLKDKNDGKAYPIEVIATAPHPAGKKAHETVLTIDVKPSDVAKAIEGLGLKPGKPAAGETAVAEGPEVKVYLEVDGARVSLDKVLMDPRTEKPFPTKVEGKPVKFHFTGSTMMKLPEKNEEVYGADATGTLVCLFPVTSETVIQGNFTLKQSSYLKLDTNKKNLPKEGTPVKLIIEVPPAP